jgi:hypothetical protein
MIIRIGVERMRLKRGGFGLVDPWGLVTTELEK